MRMAFCYLLFNSAPCWECVVLKFNNQLKASFLFISHTLCNLISKEASVRKKIKRIDRAKIPNIFCKVGKLFQEQIKGKKIFSNICLGWRVNVFVHSMTSLWERRQLQEQLWELLLSARLPLRVDLGETEHKYEHTCMIWSIMSTPFYFGWDIKHLESISLSLMKNLREAKLTDFSGSSQAEPWVKPGCLEGRGHGEGQDSPHSKSRVSGSS